MRSQKLTCCPASWRAPFPSTHRSGPTLQQPIEPTTLAALTLQSLVANNGPPSVETLQALPTIPTPIETVSRANADAAQLQSFISASRKEHSG
ncbi:g11502 [Coccomyxa elongata]